MLFPSEESLIFQPGSDEREVSQQDSEDNKYEKSPGMVQSKSNQCMLKIELNSELGIQDNLGLESKSLLIHSNQDDCNEENINSVPNAHPKVDDNSELNIASNLHISSKLNNKELNAHLAELNINISGDELKTQPVQLTENLNSNQESELMQIAQIKLKNKEIPFRTCRTALLKCTNDEEYLTKLYCLRLVFKHLLKDLTIYKWISDAGRRVLAGFLIYAEKDPNNFYLSYDKMLEFMKTVNWMKLEEELRSQDLQAITFYDVVLDYIIMDSFDDLDNPPFAVTAVLQNRWLSNRIKESALMTAVRSVIKAKRKLTKFHAGFLTHFYSVSEHISPLLAWGFMGSDEALKDTCIYFKEEVMGLLQDIFSSEKCRFTTIEELGCDIFSCIQIRVDNICKRFACKKGQVLIKKKSSKSKI